MSTKTAFSQAEPGSYDYLKEMAQKFTDTYFKHQEAEKEAEECKYKYEVNKEHHTGRVNVVGGTPLESVINTHKKWQQAIAKAEELKQELQHYSKELEYFYDILGQKDFMLVNATHEFIFHKWKDGMMRFKMDSL